jgi:tetratricopeptide (TPR) repeat protein
VTRHLSWKLFMLRWLTVGVVAVAAWLATFSLCQWLMPPLLTWMATHATFSGGPDLVARIKDFGSVGVASLAFFGVVAGTRGWAEEARPRKPATTKPSAPEQVVFGAIPQPAWCFQPRPAEQTKLRQALATDGDRAALVALPGARGVGKSQLAAAYARECTNAGYGLVAWINAESGPITDLAQLAEQLGLGANGDLTPQQLAERVRSVLQRRDGVRRLVVFDNVEDPTQVSAFLPATGTAKVIITSNRQEFSTMAGITSIPVAIYTTERGLAFLAEATNLPDDADAIEAGNQMGWLPLGLTQAAAYIRHNKLSYQQYLTALSCQDLDETLTQRAGADHPGVLKATALSIAGLHRADPTGLSTRLLVVLSVLSSDGISRALLTREHARAVLQADSTAMARALRILADASLITINVLPGQLGAGPDAAVLSVHRLTARVIRYQAGRSGSGQLTNAVTTATEVLDTFTRALPFAQVSRRRSELNEIILHIIALREHTLHPQAGLLALCNWAGRALRAAGDFTRAVSIFQATLTDRERVLGTDHPRTLGSRNNLAGAYRVTGRLDESIALHESTLTDRVRILGTDHPSTLESRNCLAMAYRAAGRLGESIALHEATVADRVRVLGADDSSTLNSRNNLAYTYRTAGRLDEAITLFQATVADRERILGADHRSTLISRHNLAASYRLSGRLEEAIMLEQAVLRDRERILGADHPDTLDSRNDLTLAYQAAGRLDDVIALHQAILSDRVRIFGADHPDVLESRSNLAGAYMSAGRLDDAITLYRAVLADYERIFNHDHPAIKEARINLDHALSV